MTAGHNVVKTVFLECGAMFRVGGPIEMRCVGETEFVNGVAAMARSDVGRGWQAWSDAWEAITAMRCCLRSADQEPGTAVIEHEAERFARVRARFGRSQEFYVQSFTCADLHLVPTADAAGKSSAWFFFSSDQQQCQTKKHARLLSVRLRSNERPTTRRGVTGGNNGLFFVAVELIKNAENRERKGGRFLFCHVILAKHPHFC